MIKETNPESSDLDGVPEYLLNIEGVEAAVMLYERGKPDEVKVSFRSRGIAVDKTAQSLGGGGHRYAAGCTVYGDIREIEKRVLALLEKEINTGG
jgi:phosphoesterase RecJ-like protein